MEHDLIKLICPELASDYKPVNFVYTIHRVTFWSRLWPSFVVGDKTYQREDTLYFPAGFPPSEGVGINWNVSLFELGSLPFIELRGTSATTVNLRGDILNELVGFLKMVDFPT